MAYTDIESFTYTQLEECTYQGIENGTCPGTVQVIGGQPLVFDWVVLPEYTIPRDDSAGFKFTIRRSD